MKITIPQHIQSLFHLFESNGYSLFLIGGFVRDFLCHKNNNDYDLTTNATPHQIQNILSPHYQYEIIHPFFKTIRILNYPFSIEITTFRIELDYQNYRSPNKIIYCKSLIEDSFRRDFTINAIAYHPNLGIQDFHNGLLHLQQNKIVCIKAANITFQEDVERILRAAYLSLHLHFQMDNNCYKAFQKYLPNLTYLSSTRKCNALQKIISLPNNYTFFFLYKTNLIHYLLPLIKYTHFQNYNTTYFYLTMDQQLSQQPYTFIEKLAILCLNIYPYQKDKDSLCTFANKLLTAIGISKSNKKQIHSLLKNFPLDVNYQTNSIFDFLTFISYNNLQSILKIQSAFSTYTEKIQIQNILQKIKHLKYQKKLIPFQDLAINGNDLQVFNYDKRKTKQLLLFAYHYTLLHPSFNTKKQLLLLIYNKIYND